MGTDASVDCPIVVTGALGAYNVSDLPFVNEKLRMKAGALAAEAERGRFAGATGLVVVGGTLHWPNDRRQKSAAAPPVLDVERERAREIFSDVGLTMSWVWGAVGRAIGVLAVAARARDIIPLSACNKGV